jgi:cytoskeletal protein RodZ
MQENPKAVGNIFKQRRKEMNLSLKEAENATSIRISYLQAIEDGEMNKLISPVYGQGFMRQYATFLGIDGDRILRENPEIFGKHASHEFSYGIGTLEMRGNQGGGVKWFPNILWVLALISIIMVAWLLARFLEVI